MITIFSTVTNTPYTDESRKNTVIDHYQKMAKSGPETKHRKRGPIIPAVGSLYTSIGALPYKPSYAKITAETILHDPDDYEITHNVEIIDHKVYFNGRVIASAPEPFTGKLKGKSQWTPARRLQFCKAVVWAIDPSYQGYVTKRVKNSNGQMEDQSFPDDLYFRELIALYPAVPAEPVPVESIAVPEVIPVLKSPLELSKEDFDKCFKLVNPVQSGDIDPCPDLPIEQITGYPNTEEILAGKTFYPKIPVEIIELSEMEESSTKNDEYDNYYSSVDHSKNEIKEMWQCINPVQVQNPANIIRSWTRGRMIITEEMIIA